MTKHVGKRKKFEYCKKELLEKLKNFRSAAYKGNDAPPVDDRFGRPRYQYDQFKGWNENTKAKTAKTAKELKAVK